MLLRMRTVLQWIHWCCNSLERCNVGRACGRCGTQYNWSYY